MMFADEIVISIESRGQLEGAMRSGSIYSREEE